MATTTRFYLAPKVGTGDTGTPDIPPDPYRPKYFVDAVGLSWIEGGLICQDYGQEPTYFVTANMTDAEHARILRIAADVIVVVPEPTPALALDLPVGAYAPTLWERLEDHNLPALWIDPSATTYRDVLHHLQRCLHLAQRLSPYGRLFPPGTSLDTHLFSLAPAQRQRLADAVALGGGTDAPLHDTHTLRTAITLLANQLPYPTELLGVAL